MSYGNEENFFHKLEKLVSIKSAHFFKAKLNINTNSSTWVFFFFVVKFELAWYWKSLASSYQEKTAAVFQGTQIR